METIVWFTLILTVFALVMSNIDAITCYQCYSITNSNCKESLVDVSGIGTCSGDSCYTVIGKSGDITVVSRDCNPAGTGSQSGCNSYSVAGVTGSMCTCNTDKCNLGNANTNANSNANSNAVSCYQCSSITNSNCKESLVDASGIGTCSGESCYKMIGKSGDTTVVSRDCNLAGTGSQSGCKSYSMAGVTGSRCTCNENKCNVASAVTGSSTRVIVGLTLAMVLRVLRQQ